MATSGLSGFQLGLFEPKLDLSQYVEVRGDDHGYLRCGDRVNPANGSPVRVADLFSGCGGMSLGVEEACTALGRQFRPILAMDTDPEALDTYCTNFDVEHAIADPIEAIFSPVGRSRLSRRERELASVVGSIDVLVGGPPCQGHSDLNNTTRRDDPKNALYSYMARATEVLKPKHVIIENVLGAFHDRSRVVQATRNYLHGLGYKTSIGVIDCLRLGIPQRRRRLLLIATLKTLVSLERVIEAFDIQKRDVRWAIGELGDVPVTSIFDEPSIPAPHTVQRIEYLFEHGIYELPDEMRPPCHRDNNHSYKSIYGRLRWEMPAQTITSGFYSMCMGRYVHPTRKRTLTAHEAARIQFFPDFFDFSPVRYRTSLARIIGNAVPMKLSYATVLALLAAGPQGAAGGG